MNNNGFNGSGGANDGNDGVDLNLNLGPAGGGGNNNNAARFPWATDAPGGIHTLEHLLAHGTAFVEGETVCRRCKQRARDAYDLQFHFGAIADFLVSVGPALNDRAPPEWMHPALGDCGACGGARCVKAVVGERAEDVNWLFLFLGRALGFCRIGQLKWLCEKTGNHRTGAKDRVLYLSYLAVCRQLQPGHWFDGLGAA